MRVEDIDFHTEVTMGPYGFAIIDYIRINDFLYELNRVIFFKDDELAEKNGASANNCRTVSFYEFSYGGAIGMRIIYMPFGADGFIFLGGRNNAS